MKGSRHLAIFSVLAVVACGPAESTTPNHDAGTPINDAGEVCDGECLYSAPTGWFGPLLVWMGAEAAAPPCPATAPFEGYTGHGSSKGPIPCGDCDCASPQGSCAPPATLTAAASSCAGDGSGVAHTSFDPPASWGGTCNGENAIPAGKLCGGIPCVQSVTIAPLTVKQGGCLPIDPPDVQPPQPRDTFARACTSTAHQPACTALDKVCVPAAPGPEFKQCILLSGSLPDLPCPSSYPNQSIFYQDLLPVCTPCTCAAPTGSTCTGSISIFQNGMCGAPLGAPASIDATGPTCVDVPPGSALGGKTASAPSYTAGSCKPSGGAPRGAVICCRP